MAEIDSLLRQADELALRQQQAADEEAAGASSELVRRCAEAEAARAVLASRHAAEERRAHEAEEAAAAASRELVATRARCEAAEARVHALEQQLGADATRRAPEPDRSRPQPALPQGHREAAGARREAEPSPFHLEVRDLPPELSPAEIRVLLEHFGAVLSLELTSDAAALVASVRYREEAAAVAAAERLDGMELKHMRLRARLLGAAADSPQRAGSGGSSPRWHRR